MKINTHVPKGDFHGHTIYSDGLFSVKELIEEAKKQGLDYYAITDHDCLDGADEAFDLAKNNDLGIKIIYGLEYSTDSNDESIHVLGYFKDKLPSCTLRDELKKQSAFRKERAEKIFDLLKENFDIELDKSLINTYNNITRGTIAQLILEKTDKYTKRDIFNLMIGDNCSCYVPSTKISTQRGIELIHECGGIAVLAHPCLYKKNNIEDLIKLGIDGIEAIYPKTNNEETKYRNLAKKYNLVVTAGSDFHKPIDDVHGSVGTCTIKGIEIERLLNRINNK